MRTRTLVSTLSLVAVATLSGCGSDDGGDSGVLSKAELKSALISADDLGSAFEVDDSDDDDDDTVLGCLNGMDELDKLTKPERDAEIAFEAEEEPNVPAVFSTVGSFEKEADAAKVLTRFSDAVEDCTKIDVTDDDGFRMQLDVSSNSDKVDDGADGQVNLEAVGTAGGQGIEIPFVLRFSAIQIDNHVALVGFVTMAEDLGADADALEQRAYDRLAPVAAGKKVPDLEPLDIEPVDLEALLTGSAVGS
jgi:hypothetical protein